MPHMLHRLDAEYALDWCLMNLAYVRARLYWGRLSSMVYYTDLRNHSRADSSTNFIANFQIVDSLVHAANSIHTEERVGQQKLCASLTDKMTVLSWRLASLPRYSWLG